MLFLQRGLQIITADIRNKYPFLRLITSGSYFFSTKSSLNVHPVQKISQVQITNSSHDEHDHTKVKFF